MNVVKSEVKLLSCTLCNESEAPIFPLYVAAQRAVAEETGVLKLAELSIILQ